MAEDSPSGSYLWQIANADLVLEAFERIGMGATEIEDRHMISANRSFNYEMQTAANRGVTLFAVSQGTPINLVQGTATYSLPTNCVQMLDTYYSYPNGDGTYTDRMMLPMTRTDYAQIPNKNAQAPPNRYWFQRTLTPQVTTWQVYDGSQAGALLNYFFLSQLQDVALMGSQSPDLLNRFLEAITSGVTSRLAEKFAPARFAEKLGLAKAAWQEAKEEDREQGPLSIKPQFGSYSRR
jgi:hypothetical protein